MRLRALDIDDAPIRVGPVSREHAPTEGIALDLPDDATETGPLETEFEATDAGEERADLHQPRHSGCIILRTAFPSFTPRSLAARYSAAVAPNL